MCIRDRPIRDIITRIMLNSKTVLDRGHINCIRFGIRVGFRDDLDLQFLQESYGHDHTHAKGQGQRSVGSKVGCLS